MGRIFHWTGFFYVPVDCRYFESEAGAILHAASFFQSTGFTRGGPTTEIR